MHERLIKVHSILLDTVDDVRKDTVSALKDITSIVRTSTIREQYVCPQQLGC